MRFYFFIFILFKDWGNSTCMLKLTAQINLKLFPTKVNCYVKYLEEQRDDIKLLKELNWLLDQVNGRVQVVFHKIDILV